MVLDLIRKVVDMTGQTNVVLTGGYALNCVANYWYLEQLKDEGIDLFVEPVSNDLVLQLEQHFFNIIE